MTREEILELFMKCFHALDKADKKHLTLEADRDEKEWFRSAHILYKTVGYVDSLGHENVDQGEVEKILHRCYASFNDLHERVNPVSYGMRLNKIAKTKLEENKNKELKMNDSKRFIQNLEDDLNTFLSNNE